MSSTDPRDQQPDNGTWHHAQCHCGSLVVSFRSKVQSAVRCNCSYCVRKAALHHRVPASCFRFVLGASEAGEYQFGTKRARHIFCRKCGVHTHCHPRSAPLEINVNLRCVDSYEAIWPELTVTAFDGRAWREEIHHQGSH